MGLQRVEPASREAGKGIRQEQHHHGAGTREPGRAAPGWHRALAWGRAAVGPQGMLHRLAAQTTVTPAALGWLPGPWTCWGHSPGGYCLSQAQHPSPWQCPGAARHGPVYPVQDTIVFDALPLDGEEGRLLLCRQVRGSFAGEAEESERTSPHLPLIQSPPQHSTMPQHPSQPLHSPACPAGGYPDGN